MRTKACFVMATALSLGGCATGADTTLPYMGGPDNFGEANRMTMAAQVIDPDPVYASAIPETHGEHAGQAVDRYRKDKVKLPDRTKTTDSVLGESGSK